MIDPAATADGLAMTGEITHRDAINALTQSELIALKAPTDADGLRHLGAQVGLLILTGVLIMGGWSVWLTAIALVAHGVLLVFLFAPLHESIHETAFRSHWLNQAVAAVAGFLLFLPPKYFRYFHLAHHRHTQDREMDPELITPKPTTWPAYLWRLSGLDYWRGQVSALAACAIGSHVPSFVPRTGRTRVVREARIYVAIYIGVAIIAIALSLSWVWWLWILPVILGQPFLRAYLLAEHTGCAYVPDMLVNSRTVFAGPIVHWLAWNMPNHTAHHAMPSVPFHRLPELTARLRENLKVTAPTYVTVHRQITREF